MLKDYEAFLQKKCTVKPQYVHFYLKWVLDCYAFLDKPHSTWLNNDEKKEFLSHMAKQYEDWQMKQADTALRLYSYFLSKEMQALDNGVSSGQGGWKIFEEKMRKALKLRHRSYSTEKTYMIC